MAVPAFFSVFVTLGLVLTRPRVGSVGRIGPGTAAALGVLVMWLAGVVGPRDLWTTLGLAWRPLVAITAIMVMTHAADEVGVMQWLAAWVEDAARGSLRRLFALVYLLAALTSAVLNNDSAILLLTPLVVALARRRAPGKPEVLVAFAFAVFLAAGVAPLVVSNPMNMIVAASMGVEFNAYAARMIPIAIAGWLVGYAVLSRLFRRALDDDAPASLQNASVSLHNALIVRGAVASPRATRLELSMLVLVLGVLAAYPAVAYFGGPVWSVAVVGAGSALLLAARKPGSRPRALLSAAISWDILAFLVAVSVLGAGLRNVGVVGRLTALYADGGACRVALLSALGSATVNNHPMSVLNMLALHGVPGDRQRLALAALIGGDLGPRLLPMGSLAGLLWLASLRRLGVDVAPTRFAKVGAVVLAPTLAVSIALLYLLT